MKIALSINKKVGTIFLGSPCISIFYIIMWLFISLVYTKKTKSAPLLPAKSGVCRTGSGQAWSSKTHAFISQARAPQAVPRIPHVARASFQVESV